MVYLITYDLNKAGKDYESLYSALKEYQFERDADLDSVWFVSTSWTAGQIFEDLKHHIDSNDRLFITQIQKDGYFGWMRENIWPWINDRV